MSYKKGDIVIVRFPFQKLLNVVDQLTPEEKLVLRKKLEKGKVATWQQRFRRALQQVGKRHIRVTEEEVEKA